MLPASSWESCLYDCESAEEPKDNPQRDIEQVMGVKSQS